jgi:hypothetical protein
MVPFWLHEDAIAENLPLPQNFARWLINDAETQCL